MITFSNFKVCTTAYPLRNAEYSQRIVKPGDYACSGPLCQGARSFYELESIAIVFSTKKDVRKPVSIIDFLKNTLSWTPLMLTP